MSSSPGTRHLFTGQFLYTDSFVRILYPIKTKKLQLKIEKAYQPPLICIVPPTLFGLACNVHRPQRHRSTCKIIHNSHSNSLRHTWRQIVEAYLFLLGLCIRKWVKQNTHRVQLFNDISSCIVSLLTFPSTIVIFFT